MSKLLSQDKSQTYERYCEVNQKNPNRLSHAAWKAMMSFLIMRENQYMISKQNRSNKKNDQSMSIKVGDLVRSTENWTSGPLMGDLMLVLEVAAEVKINIDDRCIQLILLRGDGKIDCMTDSYVQKVQIDCTISETRQFAEKQK